MLEVLEVRLGKLRIAPIHKHVLAILVSCSIAAVEAALFDRLPVGEDDLAVVDGVDADRAHLGASVHQRAKRRPGFA